MGLYAHVGQAGIDGVNQVQVSNYSPVSQNTVIAQPQMLLLVSDKHLNRPAFEITDDDGRGGQFEIVGHQRPIAALAFAACKDNVDFAKPLHNAFAHRNAIESCAAKAFDAVPAAAVTQHIAAVFLQTSADAADGKVAIGHIVPFTLFAGVDHGRAKIERIEQDRHVELFRKCRSGNGLGGEFRELTKRLTQFGGVFFFDIEPAAQWDGDASIIETGLEDHVAFGVGSTTVQMDSAGGIHNIRILACLRLIDDQEHPPVFLRAQTSEHIQGDLLYDHRLVPDGPPKKLAVIGSVCRTSQGPGQPIDRVAPWLTVMAMTKAQKCSQGLLAKWRLSGLKKRWSFPGILPIVIIRPLRR